MRCARSGWFPAHQANRELGGGPGSTPGSASPYHNNFEARRSRWRVFFPRHDRQAILTRAERSNCCLVTSHQPKQEAALLGQWAASAPLSLFAIDSLLGTCYSDLI